MKHDLIKVPANHCGFTDVFTIDYTDLTGTVDDADQTLTLDALAFGDIVYAAMVEIVTAFTAQADAEELDISIGVTSATTQFIGKSPLVHSNAAIAAKTAYCQAEGFAPYPTPTGGKNILATVELDDANSALEDNTTGLVLVWLQISRWADRVGNRQIG